MGRCVQLGIRLATSIVLAFGVAIGGPAPATAQDAAQMPLVDQAGRTFRLADFRGAPTVLTFVATRCTDTCPIANAAFRHLESELDRRRMAARLVTVTLDPDYDTPFVLAQLGQAMSVDAERWRLASGRPTDVRAFMRAFGVTTHVHGHGVPEVHSTFVYVIDSRGRLERTMLLSSNLVDETLAILARPVVAVRAGREKTK